ncbi:MAG: PHP-associated domain-containing protein [Candidatus Goldiibacteriota bacterium]|jgi:predicted metal-dependent phosphoesterase TrpH
MTKSTDTKLEIPAGFSKADYHLHTSVGDAVCTSEEIVDYAEKNTDLRVIAITDHDQIKGGITAQQYAEKMKYKIEVISGEEVSTLKGHLIGLFMKKRIRRYTGLIDTIKEIHAQGGICIVPHPLSYLTTSVGERAFRQVIEHKSDDVYFDAVELINPAIAGRVTDPRAKKLNDSYWKLPATGGSDSHSLEGIGDAFTLFKGTTAEDFRASILNGTTTYGGKYWDFNDHWKLFVEKLKKFKVF